MDEVYKSIETDIEINVFFDDDIVESKNISLVFEDENGSMCIIDYYPDNSRKSPYAKYVGEIDCISTGTVRPALRVLLPKGSFHETSKLYYYCKERFTTTNYLQTTLVRSDYIKTYTGIRLISEAYSLPTLTDTVDNTSGTVDVLETGTEDNTTAELTISTSLYVIYRGADAPTSNIEQTIWYNEVAGETCIYNTTDSEWQSLGGGGCSGAEDITYSALKTLKDASELIVGGWYHITDYATTVSQTNCQVAPTGEYIDFTILVMATSTNTFSEDALVPEYSNWEVKYHFENTLYLWTATDGTGTIYYMKDSNSNETPYDSANVQFLSGSVYVNTFDSSNKNIVLKSYYSSGYKLNEVYFGNSSISNVFGHSCYYNTLGNSSSSNIFGHFCYSNTFGDACSFNTLGALCYSNTFGDASQYNTFDNYCYSNTFESNTKNITLKGSISNIDFTGKLPLNSTIPITVIKDASGNIIMQWYDETTQSIQVKNIDDTSDDYQLPILASISEPTNYNVIWAEIVSGFVDGLYKWNGTAWKTLGGTVDDTVYQKITDPILTTTATTIPEAINEANDLAKANALDISNIDPSSFANKYASFIKWWEQRCYTGTAYEYGSYNGDETFTCNDITDIGIDEAILMQVLFGNSKPNYLNAYKDPISLTLRTTLSLSNISATANELSLPTQMFYGNGYGVPYSIRFAPEGNQIIVADSLFFYYVRGAGTLYGVILLTASLTFDMRGTSTVNLVVGKSDATSFDFSIFRMSVISYDSMSYLLTNYGNTTATLTTARTLTVHADIWSKIYDSANADYAVWSALDTLATSKNITITF